MEEITRKVVTIEDAAYHIGIPKERLRNLIKRGDFSDVAEVKRGTGKKVACFILPAAFFAKYALTWEDIFEGRRQRGGKESA